MLLQTARMAVLRALSVRVLHETRMTRAWVFLGDLFPLCLNLLYLAVRRVVWPDRFILALNKVFL